MTDDADRSNSPGLIEELDQLAAELRDGEQSTELNHRLAELLASHPECRDRFVRQMFLSAILSEEGHSLLADSESRRFRLTSFAYGLAAVILLSLFALIYYFNKPNPPVDAPITPIEKWQTDFESGIGSKWNEGEWVSAGLPRGSKGGIRMEKSKDGFVMGASDNDRGLFDAFDDSHIRIVYKMDGPDWINLFLVTPTDKEDEWQLYNYVLTKQKTIPGTWYDLTIPLTMIKGKTETGWAGPPPSEGDTVERLFFSNVGNDRGFVIDEIEVVRGGPGKVTLTEHGK